MESHETINFEESSGSGLLDGIEVNDSAFTMPVKPARSASIKMDRPLDAIKELNFEASSDDQDQDLVRSS